MNKKIVILVVVVECILAIILIGVMGLAIENMLGETKATEIYFTTAPGDVTLKPSETGAGWAETEDGRYILVSGSLYREKEKTLEWLPTPDHTDEELDVKQDVMIEVARPERGYQLYYVIQPVNTTDKTVTFSCDQSEDKVSVSENGFVTFFEDVTVTVTISTKYGKTATIILFPKRDMESDVEI